MDAESTLWCDVYDASWRKVGDGPINLISASITRAFDGAGSITLDAPSTDKRVIQWLTNERRVKIYQIENNITRVVGTGIIRKVTKRSTAGSYTRSCSGPDALDELKRINTLLNRKYSDLPVADVADSLSVLAGWTSTTESTVANQITARFDGASILKALQTMTEQVGLHLRLSASIDRQVEIGAFGQSIGLYITTPEILAFGAYGNAEIALVDSLTVTSDSEAVCNWIIPIGGGEGESALTLEHCTRTSPYPIETTVVDDKTLYFIQDAYSTDNYGDIQKVGQYKEISPLSNSDTATTLAANALYDAAVAYLQRAAVPQTTYSFSIKKCATVIRPGDRVHLAYRGVIRDLNGEELASEAVEGDFYVLKVTERLGEGGATITLEVSNIDKQMQSEAAIIVGAIESISLRNLKPMTYPYRESYSIERPVQQWDGQPSYTRYCTMPLKIDDTVTSITSVRVTIRSRGIYTYSVDFGSAMNTYHIPISSKYPQDLSLYINGIDVTTKYGGVWNPTPGNSAVDVTLDISDDIINAIGGFRQTHTIEIRVSMQTRDISVTGYDSGSPRTGVYGNQGIVELIAVTQGVCQAIPAA